MRVLRALPALIAALACPSAATALARADTPSGLPVPRYAELKHGKTHCRRGPSLDHPPSITFVRAGIPVQITAETRDHWRRIRDVDGAECWVHRATLRAAAHVIVRRAADLHVRPDAKAPVRVRLGPGVLAETRDQRRGWRRLSAGGATGWAYDAHLWGAD
jgi:SH3-like domain-containing protein